ncbi:MAG: heme lyase CcmF/NrfE family subunit, partial [Candidatus Puniceispirillaceae bacterium]
MLSPEIGHFCLILALATSAAQIILPTLGLLRADARLSHTAEGLQIISSIAIFISFASLIYAFMVSDFSVQLVASHSHSLKPMIYKITGSWGNHEGSLLLWIVILGLFGLLFVIREARARLKTLTLIVMGGITLSFLAFSLFTSNPFTRLSPAPIDGRGLNPVLQDIGLALHPPMLYLGYVGLSVAFAIAIAGLITGQVDKNWARITRFWVALAWSALTAGIALGSWWAYYELGWGGWWFWDPVENASLMPWLIGTALLHSAIVVEKRDALKS